MEADDAFIPQNFCPTQQPPVEEENNNPSHSPLQCSCVASETHRRQVAEEEENDSDLELEDHLNRNFVRNRRYTESMVRIQAMAMSDEDDDYGE